MIQASQSQTKTKNPNLEFHKEISRHRFWEQKLLIASIISAALVFLLWLVAVPVFYRLIVFLISFLAALAIKVESPKNWAFSWIAKSIGLSYETALELNQNDPYNLNTAVIKRAKLLSLKLEKPQQNFWWLPIVALAIGFVILPFSPFNAVNILSTLQPNNSTNISTEIENSTTLNQDNPEANLEDNPKINSLNNDQAPDDDNNLDQEQSEGLSDGVSEDEALSDYLENVKQRDKPKEPLQGQQQEQEQQAKNPFSSIQDSPENPDTQQQNGSGQQQQEGQEQSQDGQRDPNSQQASSQGEQEQQEGNDEKRDGESSTEGKEQGQNQDNKSSEQNQEEQSNMPANSDSESNENSQPEEGGQNSDQQSSNPSDPQADQPLGEGEKGQDGVGKDPTAEGQSSGDPDIIEAQQTEPEFLEGELKRGDSNQAGTVRQSGNQDNKGSSQSNKAIFNRGQEEAISEGSIPLEYQEIIRNYFR